MSIDLSEGEVDKVDFILYAVAEGTCKACTGLHCVHACVANLSSGRWTLGVRVRQFQVTLGSIVNNFT